MRVLAYDIVLLLSLLLCVSSSRVRMAGVKDSDEELFVPIGGVRHSHSGVHRTAHVPQPEMPGPDSPKVVPALRFHNQLFEGRRGLLGSAALGGASLVLGTNRADAELLEAPEAIKPQMVIGDLEFRGPWKKEDLLDENPGLLVLEMAKLSAFYQKQCEEIAATAKESDDVFVLLRQHIAKDLGALVKLNRFKYNLQQVLLEVETEKYDDAEEASFEIMKIINSIYDGTSNDAFFGTQNELVRFAKQFGFVRDSLMGIFNALPAQEQDRLYSLAQKEDFAQEYEQLVGKLERQ